MITAEKKVVQNVDSFGSRVGSKLNRFNMAIGKTPRTVKQLVEAAAIEVPLFQGKLPQLGSFWRHLRSLEASGLVVRSEKEGHTYFALASGVAKPKTTKARSKAAK